MRWNDETVVDATVIEGTFRLIAERELPTRTASARPARKSPNRQRAVARIVFWNLAVVFAAVVLPYLIG